MATPFNYRTPIKAIKLLPQEKEGNYKFSGMLIATPAAIEKFGATMINIAYVTLRTQVRIKSGLDYLQVFEIYGEKLWFIDDMTHVICLLPDDY